MFGSRPAVAQSCTRLSGDEVVSAESATNRWIYTPTLADGTRLRFYLDSGGGANMLFRSAVQRLGLPVTIDTTPGGFPTVPTPAFPNSRSNPAIPAMSDGPSRLMVPPEQLAQQVQLDPNLDGFLGRIFHADRVWTFDYPAHRLTWYPGGLTAASPAACWRPLGFQTDSSGGRTMHFPRVQAVIDGDTLDLLFDTGATSTLTDSALAIVNDGEPGTRGSSFMARSVVERWRARHPDWLVIDRGEDGTHARLIRVPKVELGGIAVGPVWFAERPDPNFHKFMSSMMDRRIDGAIGGSAFRYLRVTIDYPNARVRFER